MPTLFIDSKWNYGNKGKNEQNRRLSDQWMKGSKQTEHTDHSKVPILPFFPLADTAEGMET